MRRAKAYKAVDSSFGPKIVLAGGKFAWLNPAMGVLGLIAALMRCEPAQRFAAP